MTLNRKEFIETAYVAFASFTGDTSESDDLSPYKSVRFESIRSKGSVLDKLLLVKKAGFNAVEVNSQGYNRKEMLLAAEKLNLKIASVYHCDNWVLSISSIDDDERRLAVKSVLKSISVAEFYKADFVQLIPGHVDENKTEESHKSLLKSLQEISFRLRNSSLKVLVQNFPSMFFNNADYFLDVFKVLQSKSIGFCLSFACLNQKYFSNKWSKLLNDYPSKIDADNKEPCSVRYLTDLMDQVNCISVDFTDFRAY